VPLTLLHPVITVSPFCKWGIDFMTFNPPYRNGHKYIFVVVYYFTKWIEAMPTFNNTADTTPHFFFNHIITRFGGPLQLLSSHGQHFENEIFVKIPSVLASPMRFPPHTTLSPMDRLRLLKKSSKPCCNELSTNIRPTGIIFFFSIMGLLHGNQNCHPFYIIPSHPWD
jgi:hypothetical protein